MAKAAASQVLDVSAPNFKWVTFKIEGTSPYCQNAFPEKARQEMIATQEAGSQGKSRKKRDAKDFDKCYQQAMHVSQDGWTGIPASAFRAAMISACRAAGVVMTRAKLAVFVEPDGFDKLTGEPLVKITKGKPKRIDAQVRNASGVVDIRPRPVWDQGWQANVTVRHDADMLSATDVGNLLMRVGMQVGIGEGRADSKQSCGIGYGFFKICE